MALLKILHGDGEVIVPPLTWVSDVATVLQTGFTPVFADIDPRTLGMAPPRCCGGSRPHARRVPHPRAGLRRPDRGTDRRIGRPRHPADRGRLRVARRHVPGRKLGTIGWMSNFSFYYAHHLSTIEGGMVCTDDAELYETLRMLRSHGMVREATSAAVRERAGVRSIPI